MDKLTSSHPLISQAENLAGNFGFVTRSSAIFWIKNDKFMQTTIAISNYWKFKNLKEVELQLVVRHMDGRLLRVESVNFENSEIYNYSLNEDFEGSVEVNAFSDENIRIPYAAVMAVYECVDSISMVHSYSRIYSREEIREERIIKVGEESCWTVRETQDTTSFCVLHNGAVEQEAQSIKLAIRNHQGQEKVFEIELKKLKAYETLVLYVRMHCPGIIDWLNNQPGNGRLSFKLNGAFTRMLCGIKKMDLSQLQVTHSNFDYSRHLTDKVDGESVTAYMITPNTVGRTQEVVIYPDSDNGQYSYRLNSHQNNFTTGETKQIKFNNGLSKFIKFSKKGGALPTRIVTALRLYSTESTIPAECSLGVTHHKIPKKQFSWMLASKKFRTTIYWIDFRDIYGGCPSDAKLTFKIYEAGNKLPIERHLRMAELPANQTIVLTELFPALSLLDESYCCLTVWCEYGGLVFFSSLEKLDSITIEHSF